MRPVVALSGAALALLLGAGTYFGIAHTAQTAHAAPPVLAAGYGPGPDGEARHHRRHHGRFGMFGDHRPGEHIDGRLAFLKAELAITDAQEDVWRAFETAMRQNAEDAKSRFEAVKDDDKPNTVPDRLARAETMMTAGLEALRAIKDETTNLYHALSDEQKATADELLGPRGRRH